jgi:hypothetical protein
MLTYSEGTYLIQCDRCDQQQTTRATAIVVEQFKTMAKSWGWSFDTEHGDLCRACSKDWRLGRLDAGGS